MKRCGSCKLVLAAIYFYADPRAKSLLSSACKACTQKRTRDWELRNKEATVARRRAYYLKNKEKVAVATRRNRLRRKFGMSVDDYDQMLFGQGGGCAICGTKFPGGSGRFHVDHDHRTGLVRGLLCNNHNIGLGAFADSTDHLLAAVAYLMARGRGK